MALYRRHVLVVVAALFALIVGGLASAPTQASPAQEYSGPYFGKDNLPPGCIRDYKITNPANICHRMKTDLNALDSPEVDIVVLVPVSPTAERDLRIARQAVEMWDGGINYLAPQMGLDWLADGVNFHITADYFDPSGGGLYAYPIVDPEIVVIVGNPVPTGGIGIDPVDFISPTLQPRLPSSVYKGEDAVPCHGLENPFDFEYWQSLPGFDRDYHERSGVYVEDCGGGGGNTCFAVAGAVDPKPDETDGFKVLFDLVAHEFGHCLSVGHVGDGGEAGGVNGTPWGVAPYGDIMSYSDYPARNNTCVSTLDLEVLAIRMSNYLDTNGDGVVNSADRLQANDQIGHGGKHLQVQHPDDHLYASSTGSVLDCPQPDLGLVAGPRTDWTPEPADSVDHTLSLTSPKAGAGSVDGRFDVAGTVERRSATDESTSPTGSYQDASGDSSDPKTDIVGLDVELTATDLIATIHLAEMWTETDTSLVNYSLMVNGWAQESSMQRGTVTGATWDVANKTVTYTLARSFLLGYQFRAPYNVSASARWGWGLQKFDDDFAPEPGHVVSVGDPVSGGGNGPATGHVNVYVDGTHAGSQDVDTSQGADTFSIPVQIADGTHQLRVDWEDAGEVVATRTVTVARGPDDDGDGVINSADNCVTKPNANQSNIDGDAKGDVCDSDMDGDGYANDREIALGTDPADPKSHPLLP